MNTTLSCVKGFRSLTSFGFQIELTGRKWRLPEDIDGTRLELNSFHGVQAAAVLPF